MKKYFHECNVCKTPGVDFISIEKSLGDTLKSNKFPYSLSRFETLNYKNYSCSNCYCSDRDRLYMLYMDSYVMKEPSSLNLLDFAPSDALRRRLKSNKKIAYRSADLFMEDVDDKVDITDMKIYEEESFDFFICSHVLEHVDSDKKALNELYRVTKKGGKGILMVPIIKNGGTFDEDTGELKETEKWRRFAQGDHVRLYTKEVFLERVNKSGFKVQQLTYRELGLRNFVKHGISIKSVLYILEK